MYILLIRLQLNDEPNVLDYTALQNTLTVSKMLNVGKW